MSRGAWGLELKLSGAGVGISSGYLRSHSEGFPSVSASFGLGVELAADPDASA